MLSSEAFDWGWILEDEVEQKRRAASLSLFSFCWPHFYFYIYYFFWGGELEYYSIPFSPLHFTFHISTCIPSGVLTPLAENKEKFMSSKALIMIPKILLERRIEMSIKGGGDALCSLGTQGGGVGGWCWFHQSMYSFLNK